MWPLRHALILCFLASGILSFFIFIYGMIHLISEPEENLCQMTYMFEHPQYVRIDFKENNLYPKYALYAYAEGIQLTREAREKNFYGAPVIFVPGNSGSYKQGRSLASVALRKRLNNLGRPHMDFFTIDLNEEYTGLFGGYLRQQQAFLELCIKQIVRLYKGPAKQVVLIGHSMGAKLAQSITVGKNVSKMVNTVICLAGPLRGPVLNMDVFIDEFYEQTNTNLSKKLDRNSALLITIGGGNRDIMVHSGLTDSIFSDLHAIATAVPFVWVPTDHLSAVWCLQLVLTVNRFLYAISDQTTVKGNKRMSFFVKDKEIRLQTARNYFQEANSVPKLHEINLIADHKRFGEWTEDSRSIYLGNFEHGVDKLQFHMIRLVDSPNNRRLTIRLTNSDDDVEWIFGCNANEFEGLQRYCSKGLSLSHLIKKYPKGKENRWFLNLDLEKLRRDNPTWSHIVVRLTPNKKPLRLDVNVFDPLDRTLEIDFPSWYSLRMKIAVKETKLGTNFYRIFVRNLERSYEALILNVKPTFCPVSNFEILAEVSIPWSRGSTYYKQLYAPGQIIVTAPTSRPALFDGSGIFVNLYVDARCTFSIEFSNSLKVMSARIAQQYFHWIPAHLTSSLFLSFRQQLFLRNSTRRFKCGNLLIGILKSSSLLFAIVASIIAEFFSPTAELTVGHSVFLTVIIHGTAYLVLLLATLILWISATSGGTVGSKMLPGLRKLPLPSMPVLMMPIIEKIPILAAVILIGIANSSCGGIALICGCIIYFIIIMKTFEAFIENFALRSFKAILRRVFRTRRHAAQSNTRLSASSRQLLLTLPDSTDHRNEVKDTFESASPINETTVANDDIEEDDLSTINFHFALFLLLLILSALNVPSTLSWAKNFKYAQKLTPDPSLWIAIVVLAALSIIWQFSTPPNMLDRRILSLTCYIYSAGSILFCRESIFRLNSVISSFFILIVFHRIFAPKGNAS